MTAAGGRIVEGPEDFNAYGKKRVEQADKGLKLAKIAIGASVAVGVTAVVLSGMNIGKDPGGKRGDGAGGMKKGPGISSDRV